MQNALIVQETITQYPEQDVLFSDLIPPVWNALEEIIKSSTEARNHALDELIEVSAPSTFPIVAYILAAHVVDPDIAFRVRTIEVLGEALSLSNNGYGASEDVRCVLLEQ